MLKAKDFDLPAVKKEISGFLLGIKSENENNTEAFIEAIKYCKENDINRLTLIPGIYHFTVTDTIELNNLTDFEIYAKDVRFVYYKEEIAPHEFFRFFRITNCLRFKITGLKIDWNWEKARLASLVKVINKSRTFVDLEFMENGEISDNLRFVCTNQVNDKTFTPGDEDGREYGAQAVLGETLKKRRKLSKKVYRCYTNLKNDNDKHFKIGTYHLLRHFTHNGGVFTIIDCAHIIFDDVTIYSAMGMGIIVAGHTHHLYCKKFKITLPDFEKRYITCTADGIHYSQSNGYSLFEDCDLGYQGDDCLNIHDSLRYGTKVSERSINFGPDKFVYCVPGDEIELRNKDLSPTGFTAKVTDGAFNENDDYIAVVDKDIPDYEGKRVYFNSEFDSSYYVIRNCYFHETRARGILAQASHGIIENCKFYAIQGAAIQIETGAGDQWAEGKGVDDLIIRNNEIINCDVNDWDKSTLYMSTYMAEGIPIKNTRYPNPTTTVGDSGADYRTPVPMFKNIVIENNVFREYPRRAMILTSFENLTLKNNTFINDISRKYNNPERGSIQVSYGKNLVDENNTFKPSPYMLMPEFDYLED